MDYTITLYAKDFSNSFTTLFFSNDFYNFSWADEINKAGSARFTMKATNTKATATNLSLYNKVIINKGTAGKFIGYIENLDVTTEEITVSCVGMLGYFEKRLSSASFTAEDIDTAIYSILTTTNSADDTGIVSGTSTISGGIGSIDFVRSTVLDAWEKLANLGDIEFEITTAKALNLVPSLGTDKSDSIILRYVSTQLPLATLLEFEVEVDGADMANKITGLRDGGATSTQDDATSIAVYGLLEDSVNFAQTASGADLDTETQNEVDQRKDEYYTPSITLNPEFITEDDVDLGDTVSVLLNNGFINVDREERIIKKTVKVKDTGEETVSLNLMPTTGNRLPSTFLGGIIGLGKKVKLLESAI